MQSAADLAGQAIHSRCQELAGTKTRCEPTYYLIISFLTLFKTVPHCLKLCRLQPGILLERQCKAQSRPAATTCVAAAQVQLVIRRLS